MVKRCFDAGLSVAPEPSFFDRTESDLFLVCAKQPISEYSKRGCVKKATVSARGPNTRAGVARGDHVDRTFKMTGRYMCSEMRDEAILPRKLKGQEAQRAGPAYIVDCLFLVPAGFSKLYRR
jgi:hypothetical protein